LLELHFKKYDLSSIDLWPERAFKRVLSFGIPR